MAVQALASVLTSLPESIRSEHAVWVLAVFPMAIVFAGRIFRDHLAPIWQTRITWLSIALAAAFIAVDVAIIGLNIRAPRDWDFKHFWTWGTAVAEGTSPYDHENLLRIVDPLNPSPELKNELYGLYPPPSLFLFAPLGWLPFKAALLAWSLVQAIALAACVYLLIWQFAPERTLAAAAPIVAMVFTFWATSATFYFSQTNFLVLLSVLLFWKDRERTVAGVWVALGTLVKPLVIALGLYLLLRRQWGALLAMASSFAFLVVVTYLAFGADVFVEFKEREGVSRQLPVTEDIHQSLPTAILRLTSPGATADSLLKSPAILTAVGLVVSLTALVILAARDEGDPYAAAATIAMMLMIYPGTLTHYGVVLLPALALVLSDAERGKIGRGQALFLLSVVFLLYSLRVTIPAMLLTWMFMAYVAMRYKRATVLRPQIAG